MDYFVGGLAGAIAGQLVVVLIILMPLHWIARKIRRVPRKTLWLWLTSWPAGPELLVLGVLFEAIFRNIAQEQGEALTNQINILAAATLQYAGALILIIKIIASIVSRFRRKVPTLPQQ